MNAPCDGRDLRECQSCLRHIDRHPTWQSLKARWVPMVGPRGCMDHKPKRREDLEQERP